MARLGPRSGDPWRDLAASIVLRAHDDVCYADQYTSARKAKRAYRWLTESRWADELLELLGWNATGADVAERALETLGREGKYNERKAKKTRDDV